MVEFFVRFDGGYRLVLSTVTCHASSLNHLDHQNQPVLIWDHKMKVLDFGSTPEGGSLNLHPHLGFVWMKAGYSEGVPWRKVALTKQRNVDLKADGVWAMPLNTGWVPVKNCRLQDRQKLKNMLFAAAGNQTTK